MKKLVMLIALSSLLLGCVNIGNSEFNLYEDAENHFSFEKPASWLQQNDPLAFVRFSAFNKASFAVSVVPGNTSGQFEQVASQVYADFQRNGGLFNLKQENTNLAGFSAVKITSDQNLVNETANTLELVQADLFIVKDTKYNRLLLVAFTGKKDDSSINDIKGRMFSSFKIT